ncbi:hypothetical protein [Terrihabitans rhizophilus]|jgi:hypothetical protein|uniref:Uncharacterized protein n=1 Tax=Terrihabitans rhizophilus TaxID=3092662 RepID=A0ABU4RPU4_9HYPH|nr:hypothetical protein [Terrihabitans sp. PJ23]MDX6806849.1 hypothetical protein [Terrihabitans sp. PJ23]
MRLSRLLISSAAASAIVFASLPASAMPTVSLRAAAIESAPALIKVDHRHHHGSGAAVGVGLGVGLIAGAAIASAAREPDRVYIEEAPPPPPRRVYVERRVDETADEAVRACARGLLDTARRDGAFDSEVGAIDSVSPKPDGGHRVEAEVTLIYPRYERTSNVVCHTEGGYLVSARTGY